MALFSIIFTISLDRAADSISDVVTANAGSSLMTECNKDLHDKFGVLAINKDEDHLSRLASYYISESIDGVKRFVHLELNAAIVNVETSQNLYVADFKNQISALGLKSLVFGKTKESGLTSFAGTNLPSHSHSGFSLPDAKSLVSFLNAGKTIGEGAGILSYVKNIFTLEEQEYLLFGHPTVEENFHSTRNTVFAIRCVIDGVDAIEDPIALAAAILQAWQETDEIMSNRTETQRYVDAMCAAMSTSNKFAYRIMDIMQMTVGGNFNFENYTYEFDLIAQYKRGKKHGTVTQKHSYVF